MVHKGFIDAENLFKRDTGHSGCRQIHSRAAPAVWTYVTPTRFEETDAVSGTQTSARCMQRAVKEGGTLGTAHVVNAPLADRAQELIKAFLLDIKGC